MHAWGFIQTRALGGGRGIADENLLGPFAGLREGAAREGQLEGLAVQARLVERDLTRARRALFFIDLPSQRPAEKSIPERKSMSAFTNPN